MPIKWEGLMESVKLEEKSMNRNSNGLNVYGWHCAIK
jgi:hypothetical protein